MLPDETYIRELTRDVWTNVLGLEIMDAGPGSTDAESWVEITGEWTGRVRLSFSDSLGRRVTTAMFQCPENEATEDLVRDALGELANVIGGNVKALLPGPTKLSLPSVGVKAGSPDSDSEEQALWFDCEGRAFCVTISAC